VVGIAQKPELLEGGELDGDEDAEGEGDGGRGAGGAGLKKGMRPIRFITSIYMKMALMKGTNFLPRGPMIPMTKSSSPSQRSSAAAWILPGTGPVRRRAKRKKRRTRPPASRAKISGSAARRAAESFPPPKASARRSTSVGRPDSPFIGN